MGKTLYLLRHGMAMMAQGNDDFARGLAPKGKEDALALGKVMKAEGYVPGRILCSPAVRTKQTLEAVNASLEIQEVQYPKTFYNGGAGELLHHIQQSDDHETALLVVAHNPGIHQLTVLLSGQGPESMIQRLATGFAPGTLAVLSCSCENWQDIQPGENALTALLDPEDYNAPARPTRWM